MARLSIQSIPGTHPPIYRPSVRHNTLALRASRCERSDNLTIRVGVRRDIKSIAHGEISALCAHREISFCSQGKRLFSLPPFPQVTLISHEACFLDNSLKNILNFKRAHYHILERRIHSLRKNVMELDQRKSLLDSM